MKPALPHALNTNDGLRLKLRRMTEDDLPEWVQLMKQSEKFAIVSWTLHRAEKAFKNFLRSPTSLYVVATYRGRVVAYFGLILPDAPFKQVAYTDGAVVDRQFQGHGVTSALMDILELYLRSLGRKFVITTGVAEPNIPPQRILKKRGYALAGKKVGTLKIERSFVDLLVFWKKLDN